MSPPPAPHPSRSIQLDVVRGVAVVMILLNHRPHSPWGLGVIDRLCNPLSAGFWTGVDLFFVLSGYLVGGLLIAELRRSGNLDVRRFLLRRGLKIWPTYYLYLAVLIVLTTFFYVEPIPGAWRAGMMVNMVKFAYLQNYFHFSKFPYLTMTVGSHTWTLAVEEHFYLLLPFTLLLVRRSWRRALPPIAFGLLAACLLLRLSRWGQPMDYLRDYMNTHVRIDSLFFGVFLAYLSHERPAVLDAVRRRRAWVAAAGLALVAPMFVLQLEHPFVHTAGYTCLSLGYGALLLAFLSLDARSGWSGRLFAAWPARMLAWAGLWSYSIYIWHMELFNLFNFAMRQAAARFGVPTGFAGGLITDLFESAYLAASLLIGVALGRLVEGPVLAWRDRHFPSRSGSAIAPGVGGGAGPGLVPAEVPTPMPARPEPVA